MRDGAGRVVAFEEHGDRFARRGSSISEAPAGSWSFGPLGMRPADWRWEFRLDRSQRNEFGQVHLRPRDMLDLGAAGADASRALAEEQVRIRSIRS